MPDKSGQTHDTSCDAQKQVAPKPVRFPMLRSGLRLLAVLMACAVVLWSAGFVWFSADVLLETAPEAVEGDAIVVLTGGPRRIDAALKLLEDGAGERLLISGVNPSTSGESIRKLTGGDRALFDCCVDIGYEALNTRGNAVETREWIEAHRYNRMIVVTSAYHLPRSLFELRNVAPHVNFVGYPVSMLDDGEAWYRNGRFLKTLVSEYIKFLGAHIRSYAGIDAFMPASTSSQSGSSASIQRLSDMEPV